MANRRRAWASFPHHEDIARAGDFATLSEQLQQVEELSVDVPADRDLGDDDGRKKERGGEGKAFPSEEER